MSIAVAHRSPVSDGRWRAAIGGADAGARVSTRGVVRVLTVVPFRLDVVLLARAFRVLVDGVFGVDLGTWSRTDRVRRYWTGLRRSLRGVGG